MAVLTTTLGAEFTPVTGYFAAQAVNQDAQLWRKSSASAAFVFVGIVPKGYGLDVYQAVPTAVWKFIAAVGTTVEAAQGV